MFIFLRENPKGHTPHLRQNGHPHTTQCSTRHAVQLRRLGRVANAGAAVQNCAGRRGGRQPGKGGAQMGDGAKRVDAESAVMGGDFYGL